MFKPRRPRHRQPQNPVADMEQFYLNQYFQSESHPHVPGASFPPPQPLHDHLTGRVPPQLARSGPPIEMARLHQLEQRLLRLEQHLGFAPMEPIR